MNVATAILDKFFYPETAKVSVAGPTSPWAALHVPDIFAQDVQDYENDPDVLLAHQLNFNPVGFTVSRPMSLVRLLAAKREWADDWYETNQVRARHRKQMRERLQAQKAVLPATMAIASVLLGYAWFRKR